MKKQVITLLTGLAFSLTSHAQTDNGKLSFGVRAGINFTNLNGKDGSGAQLKNNLIVRYHLGANLEIPVAPEFYFQPNILFSVKGAKTAGATINLSYIEVPLNFLYKPLLGSGHLLLGFGPYVAYAVGGKFVSNGNSVKIKFKNEADRFDPTPAIKPFDAGANLLFGYEFASKFSVQLNAQLGLVNIYPYKDNSGTFKNTGFGISAGYRF